MKKVEFDINRFNRLDLLNLNTPIYNKLREYAKEGIIPFHMPGHKMGKGFSSEFIENLVKFDITEIPGTDNLHFPCGIIKEAQDLAAKAFGSEKTYFLVNGSSCGIHASIMSVLMPGDKILVTRDCHRSVIGGMMMAGANPVYINTEFDSFFGIPTILKHEILEKALKDNPDVKAVIITRPNYYGICSDIEQIAKTTHSHGKILIVDEAHGAHLKFNKTLPVSAIEAGADICIQSAHKTLPAFTQGAYLHVKSNIVDIERIEFYLRLLQTTSPSYIIMASLDIAREVMECFGEKLLEDLTENTEWIRDAVDKLGSFVPLKEDTIEEKQIDSSLIKRGSFTKKGLVEGRLMGKGLLDKTRLVLNTRNLGKTGYRVSQILREKFRIQVEMADMFNIVCICTISDSRKDFDSLYRALNKLSVDNESQVPDDNIIIQTINELPIPKQGVSLCDVGKCRGKSVILKESIGKASRDFIVPYPPGIPVICPGEIIMEETVDYIYKVIEWGGTINGIDKNFFVDIIE
jgi:lysine decarboxylase